jgi:hypothetical protein
MVELLDRPPPAPAELATWDACAERLADLYGRVTR